MIPVYRITNQQELRKTFWHEHPHLDRRKIPSHSGIGKMYKTDTRVAFVDYVDYLSKDGTISETLAQRAVL